MPLDFVSAFLKPASLVWESEFGETLQAEPDKTSGHPFLPGDLIVKIAVSGSLEGDIYYGFARGLALSLSEKIMGEVVEEVDEMTVSVIEEIANMISGRTMVDLEAKGYSCNIAPPVLVEREVISLAKLADPSTVVRLVDHDETATIWPDLTESATAHAGTGRELPEGTEPATAPVDQSAIDALFSSAA